MHLHRLEMTAIGPFPGTHVIDFSALGTSGLFLLEGPTGAGKSTIIDALVFALYGQVASASSSLDRLHCDHVAAGRCDHVAAGRGDPRVDLVFETAAGVFRVARTPAYDRPKTRGSGTSRQQASVRLWRLSSADVIDGGEPLSQRVREADDEIARAVGLTREQFVQTMVLPQGEFAAFLRADADDRRKVLQRLFGTEVYDRVQSQLEEMRRGAKAAREAASAAVTNATATFAGAAALDDESRLLLAKLAADDDPEALAGEVAEVLCGLHDARDAARREAGRAHEADEQARVVHATVLAQQQRVTRVRALRGELATLERSAAEVAVAHAKVEAHRRAEPLLVPLLAVESAEGAALVAAANESRCRGACPKGLRQAPVGALAQSRDEAITTLGALHGALEAERGLPALAAALGEAEEGVAGDREGIVAAERELTGLPGQIGQAEAVVRALRPLAGDLPVRERELETARVRRDAAAARFEVGERLAQAGEALAAGVQRAQGAVGAEARLRAARIAGMAAELAGVLKDGEQCVVCGAVEHPRPARPGENPVTAQQMEAAVEGRARAEDALEGLRDAVSRAMTSDAVLADASGGLSVPQLEAALRQSHEGVAAAAEAARGLESAECVLTDLRRAIQERRDGLAEMAAQAARRQERLTTLRREHAQAVKQVVAAAAGHPSVAERVAELALERDTLGEAIEVTQACEEASGVVLERRRPLSGALAAAGFSDASAVRQALLDASTRAALERCVASHDETVGRVSIGLAAPELLGVDPTDVVDLERARTAADAARREHDRAARACGTAEARLDGAEAESRVVTAATRCRAATVASTEPVIRVADLAAASTSDNARRMTLAAYVVRRRFEEVVEAANQRLAQVSSGRYQLQRTDEQDSGRARKGGLGLKVLDLVTETPRAPATLSGGETFYVSLSLALGLADVVTAEAGGIELNTLFVDEGFGSLDPQTLDSVLQVLSELRAGGRVVGVVSHVEEMKGRIAERIEVRRCPDGSSTLTVRA